MADDKHRLLLVQLTADPIERAKEENGPRTALASVSQPAHTPAPGRHCGMVTVQPWRQPH